MTELGGDAKTPDLQRRSALLDMCPDDVKRSGADETGRDPRKLVERQLILDQQGRAIPPGTSRQCRIDGCC